MAPVKRNSASSEQNSLLTKKTGKLPVPAPTSFSKFIVILVMHICKRILMVETIWKVGLYLCGLTVISLFTDLFPLPATYFSNKTNPFNVYLVKWGWAWTCSVLSLFIYLTSCTYCIGNRKSIFTNHMSRLLVATVWWFVSVTIMNYIEHITGFCDSGSDEHTNKYLCKTAGHIWISWDPSGHSFLLIYCLLVISEEVKCFSSWETISEVIENKDGKPTWTLTSTDSEILFKLYNKNTPLIRCVIILITILQLIWEIMLLATTVYFHNMPSKLMGAMFAVLGWLITYQLWYKQVGAIPCQPGVGKFKYMKDA